MAATLGCATETLRRYLHQLAAQGLIVKNDGNTISMTGRSGLTFALDLPDRIRELLKPPKEPMTPDPPILDETGKPIPQLDPEPGRNPSRSPPSHEVGDAGAVSEGTPRSEASPETTPARSPDWTLGDWIEADIVHAEIGDHLERQADKFGQAAVSRVLVRLEELRKLRPCLGDVRSDLERAGDIAARKLVRTAARKLGLGDAEVERQAKQACPAGISEEDSLSFVKEVAGYLTPIIREAQGDPDPWRRARRRQDGQRPPEPSPKRNAYLEAGAKRDPSAFGTGGDDGESAPF
jgi:hypothetical protein